MVMKKFVLLHVIGLVIVVAKAEAIVGFLKAHNVIGFAENVATSVLTGSTLVTPLALVWLLPNKEES